MPLSTSFNRRNTNQFDNAVFVDPPNGTRFDMPNTYTVLSDPVRTTSLALTLASENSLQCRSSKSQSDETFSGGYGIMNNPGICQGNPTLPPCRRFRSDFAGNGDGRMAFIPGRMDEWINADVFRVSVALQLRLWRLGFN